MRYCIILSLLLMHTAPALLAQSVDSVNVPGTDVTFTMVKLAGGTFKMGPDRKGVTLSPFAISAHEVTHDAYRLFQERANDTPVAADKNWDADAVSRPSPPYLDLTYGMGSRGGYPQVNTTQQAALRYCEWLYEKTGRFFRLPTEAEWEYACLAGQPAEVNSPEDVAWLLENGEESYHPVGELKPNTWGIYDMVGNVSEWTLDEFLDDYVAEPTDPWARPDGTYGRAVRGGSFDTPAAEAGCLSREKGSYRWQERDPQIPKSIWWNVDSPFVGFRLVSPEKQPSSEEVRTFFAEAIVD